MAEAITLHDVPFVAPAITEDTRDFWTGGERGELRIYRCRACATYIHPPVPVCRRCRSQDVGPGAVSGQGVLASYTINCQQWSDDFAGPYVVALVEIAEQPGCNILATIVGVHSEDELRIGMPVQVDFRAFADAWLPVFRPVA